MKRILVYVQHLLGVGHLHRTALITKALAAAGFDVTLVSGGVCEPDLDFGKVNLIQLPAIKSDAEFTALYDQQNNVIDNRFKQNRIRLLIQLLQSVEPHLIIIETYPFGRRQMRFELLPLLKQAKTGMAQPPIIASSIRDVIQPKSNPKRSQEIVDIVKQYFDFIFVHGDDSFIRFEQTFPQAGAFSEKLIYTGYVVKQPTGPLLQKRANDYILVSAGGGAVGHKLYQTVIQASQAGSADTYCWHLLVGNNISNDEFNRLAAHQCDTLKIERNRTDFLKLLSQCSVSVSQAGYNTMMDLLVTHTPAVVVPFEGVCEQEQLIRAKAFEQKELVSLVREKDLNAPALLRSIDSVSLKYAAEIAVDLQGTTHIIHAIREILQIKQRVNC